MLVCSDIPCLLTYLSQMIRGSCRAFSQQAADRRVVLHPRATDIHGCPPLVYGVDAGREAAC